MCDSCKKISRSKANKKSGITQKGVTHFPDIIKKKNRMDRINKSVEELEIEVKKLRELKEKGKFGLKQSEHSLKRLTAKLVNLWI
jgi:predicted  nucleic acid-binding Zn-ribbon protein